MMYNMSLLNIWEKRLSKIKRSESSLKMDTHIMCVGITCMALTPV